MFKLRLKCNGCGKIYSEDDYKSLPFIEKTYLKDRSGKSVATFMTKICGCGCDDIIICTDQTDSTVKNK